MNGPIFFGPSAGTLPDGTPNICTGGGDINGQCIRGCNPSTLEIQSLDLRNIDNRKLDYLSVSPHPYFGGNTRINGTIAIRSGNKTDELKSVELDVLENSKQVAVAQLAPKAKKRLLNKRFGSGGVISISTPQLLFNLASSDMAGIDQATDGSVTLEASARSKNGDTASKTYGGVTKLVLYTGSNRYGGRDPNVGGDSWVRPSVKTVLDHYAPTLLYGDMSKMNGGPFPPHQTHGDGFDVDGVYAGGSYSAHTAASAQRMLQLLNDPWGSHIGTIYVTFRKNPPDAFWTTISNAQLADGRRACRVFGVTRNGQPVPGHEGHFHWRVDHQDARGAC